MLQAIVVPALDTVTVAHEEKYHNKMEVFCRNVGIFLPTKITSTIPEIIYNLSSRTVM